MSQPPVHAVRAFNRFYTNVIGLLKEGLVDSPYTLTEARVLYELAQGDSTEVTALRQRLELDAGYLSRLLTRFAADGLISRERAEADARRQVIRLTDSGRAAQAELDRRSTAQVDALLGRLTPDDQHRLVFAMDTIHEVLDGPGPRRPVVVLRAPRPGDYGWVIQRNAAVYAEQYGWDAEYEVLVARIVADYIERRDPEREAAWIAELDGRPVGCVFCMARPADTPGEPDVAQLRLLLVEPDARGLGIGGRLVDECLRFARRVGYRQMMLWTNSVLVEARRIYERAGFRLVKEEKHHSYGHDLVGQDWWLDL
jgi:DNA-binding MarR family transcriptional regulator/GNAT superfamily N-acetyltransferase